MKVYMILCTEHGVCYGHGDYRDETRLATFRFFDSEETTREWMIHNEVLPISKRKFLGSEPRIAGFDIIHK